MKLNDLSCSLFATLPLFIAPALGDGPFSGDPPDAHHPWAVHDPNRPQPRRVEPGTFSSQRTPDKPPSDAIVLFDGSQASIDANWEPARKPKNAKRWREVGGALQCTPGAGDLQTKTRFADCQLHVEWAAPTKIVGKSQGRGNSGVFLMGETEVQVLDNYDNPSYPDGSAGALYGVSPPMANPLRPPGQWQTCDIVFRRPVYRDGKEIDGGYVTVFINGVLVQDHTPLEGGGGHRKRSKPRPFVDRGPLRLQDHGNPIRYRNIWYRPLLPRSIEGGTDGRLTREAALAKRQQIAASIRADAARREGTAKMYRLFESLCYAPHAESLQAATTMSVAYVAELGAAGKRALEKRKGEVMKARRAFDYLVKHELVPSDFAAKTAVDAIIEAQGWNKKK